MQKLLFALAVALMLLPVPGCGNRKPASSSTANHPMSAILLQKEARLKDNRPAAIYELECQGKKNLLLVLGKVESLEAGESMKVVINGQRICYNFSIPDNAVILHIAGTTLASPLDGMPMDQVKVKFQGTAIDFPALNEALGIGQR